MKDNRLKQLLTRRNRRYVGLRAKLSGGRNVCVGRADDGAWLINISRPGMRRKMVVTDETMMAIIGMVFEIRSKHDPNI